MSVVMVVGTSDHVGNNLCRDQRSARLKFFVGLSVVQMTTTTTANLYRQAVTDDWSKVYAWIAWCVVCDGRKAMRVLSEDGDLLNSRVSHYVPSPALLLQRCSSAVAVPTSQACSSETIVLTWITALPE